jgi:hypothetical protein
MAYSISGRKHYFHIVNTSPWPLFLSFSLFSFVISTVLLLHNYYVDSYLYFFSFFLVVFIMGIWWRDVIREGFFEGCHTSVVMYGLRLGMLYLLFQKLCFFCFFLGFFSFKHSARLSNR